MPGGAKSVSSHVGAVTLVAGVILTALLAGRGLSQAWTLAPDLGHGWAIPWLAGWLAWDRISTAGVPQGGRTSGAVSWALLGAGLVLYSGIRLFLEPFPLWPSLLWLLAGLLYAYLLTAAWFAGGKKWVAHLAAPLALIFTAIPWPSVMENAFLHPLRQGLALGVAEVLNLFSVPAFAVGATVQIASGVVGVDEACGGMRSLQTSLMIGWFVGELARMGCIRRLALLVGAALAAIGGNFLRALVLTWLSDAGGTGLLAKWHDPAGYLALGCTLIAVLCLGWWWRSKDAAPAAITAGRDWRPSSNAVAWAASALIVCVVTEVAVRAWYGGRAQSVAQVPAWEVKWPEQEQGFATFPLSKAAKEMLKPSVFSSAAWHTSDQRNRSGYYIEWETGQQARNLPFLHGPEVCLPMTGIELIGRKEPVMADVGGVRLPFDVYEFRQHGRLMYVFRVVWNPDEGRAASAPRDTDGWGLWMDARWADVVARRVAIRAQVLTLAITGEKNREDSLKVFHEEVSRIVRPKADRE